MNTLPVEPSPDEPRRLRMAKRLSRIQLQASARGDDLINIDAVLARVFISRSKLYQLMAAGQFPRPVKLGRRIARWVAGEVDAWRASKAAESRPDQRGGL